MQEINLNGKNVINETVQVDDTDYAWLAKFLWWGTHHRKSHWRITTCINGRRVEMARLIMRLGTKREDPIEVAHLDGDDLNCQRSNLRYATRSEIARLAWGHTAEEIWSEEIWSDE